MLLSFKAGIRIRIILPVELDHFIWWSVSFYLVHPDHYIRWIRINLSGGSRSFYPVDTDHFTRWIRIILPGWYISLYPVDPDHFTRWICIILPSGSGSFYSVDPDHLYTDPPGGKFTKNAHDNRILELDGSESQL